MILVVSMASVEDYDEKCAHTQVKRTFEKLTDAPALLQHYSQITPALVDSLPLKAIFISGSGCPWPNVDCRKLDGLHDVVMDTTLPIHGACAGHQLLGFFFNADDFRQVDRLEDEYMRPLGPGEAVSMVDRPWGMFLEQGVFEVEIVQQDLIFEGFEGKLAVTQSHSCEVKTLPPDFIHLARNDNCEIQAMRHRNRPIYGTQFHPERWHDELYPDGKRFMQNFLRIAGLID